MSRTADIALTALAPVIWGSTYIVTTQFLPPDMPVTAAALRALPAGLLLLLVVRKLPWGVWWWRSFLLGALNFTLFWVLLFVAAYRLPGGVAATVGAIQPLIVIALSRVVLATPLRPVTLVAGLAGIAGVALLVLTPKAALDWPGIAAGMAGAVSMACGTVMSRRWQPPVPPLTFTAWQLTAGGLLLVPLALIWEPALPPLTAANVAGFLWLGGVGGALTYALWFRGLARLEPAAVSALGFFSPLSAVLLGWVFLGQSLGPAQMLGAAIVLGSVWFCQRPAPRKAPS